MNERQKVLAWIFAAAIAASIVFAPWEKSIETADVGHVTAVDIQSPIWEPPARGQDKGLFAIKLRTGVLIMEWAASLLIYGAAYVALADKKRVIWDTDLNKEVPDK
jgi:hypothetical protein